MARREFTEVPYKYGDGKYGFQLAQTRSGVEEHVMPVTLWELDTASNLYMPPGASENPKRPRVEATLSQLAALASEEKLEAVRVLLASLDSKDYSTETKLEAARVLLASLDGKDYATQTTLAAAKTLLETLAIQTDGLEGALGTSADAASETGSLHAKLRQLAEAAGTNNGNQPTKSMSLGAYNPSEGKLRQLYSLGVSAADGTATASMADALVTGAMMLGFNGTTWDRLRVDANKNLQVATKTAYDAQKVAPVVGAKTVTTTAAEVFAGASKLASRYQLAIYNESSLPIYVGPSGVTTANGFPVLPGDSVIIKIDPYTAVAWYAISTGSAAVRVMEVA